MIAARLTGLLSAVRFLTRLPVPGSRTVQPADLGAGAVWFPCVGALIGLVVAVAYGSLAATDPWLAAVVAVLTWIWITGALHLDGAADLADALGARHRRPELFLEVLSDPHVGSFGVVALLCIVLMKLVSLHALVQRAEVGVILVLLPAWTRYAAVVCAQTLPPLAKGSGEQFGKLARPMMLWAWGLVLMTASIVFAPIVLIAVPAAGAWWLFLRLQLGGMTGDALGAGIEWCEAGTLLALAIIHTVRLSH